MPPRKNKGPAGFKSYASAKGAAAKQALKQFYSNAAKNRVSAQNEIASSSIYPRTAAKMVNKKKVLRYDSVASLPTQLRAQVGPLIFKSKLSDKNANMLFGRAINQAAAGGLGAQQRMVNSNIGAFKSNLNFARMLAETVTDKQIEAGKVPDKLIDADLQAEKEYASIQEAVDRMQEIGRGSRRPIVHREGRITYTTDPRVKKEEVKEEVKQGGKVAKARKGTGKKMRARLRKMSEVEE